MNDTVDKDYRAHAYVDDQMDIATREAFIRVLEQSPELRREVCELQHLKSAIRHAYSTDLKQEGQRKKSALFGRLPYAGQCVAALMILVTGIAAGWYTGAATTHPYEVVQLDQVQSQEHKIVLHIGEADEGKFSEVLSTADHLIEKYNQSGVEVEIVANAGGLDLLDSEASPQLKRVSAMIEKYDNLSFIACTSGLKNMGRQGRHIKLIDNTRQAPSALEHIVKRLQEGWQYIRV